MNSDLHTKGSHLESVNYASFVKIAKNDPDAVTQKMTPTQLDEMFLKR